jgi:hypothetical protein
MIKIKNLKVFKAIEIAFVLAIVAMCAILIALLLF